MTNSGCRSAGRFGRLGLVAALGLGGLSVGGALAPALAQPAAQPPAAAVCGAAPALLEVWVGNSARGAVPVLRVGNDIWVPADVLTDSEQGYAAGRVECPGAAYLLLSSALDIRYDDEEQTLTVRPALALLPGNVIDFAAAAPEGVLPLRALYALTSRVQASGQWGQAAGDPGALPASAQRASLNLLSAQGRWELQAGLSASSSSTQPFSVSGQVEASVRPVPTWRIRGVLSQRLWGADTLPDQTDFSGLEVSGQNGRGIVLPQFTLDLPFDSELTLAIDDQVLRQFRARAGTLVVRNLPLPRQQGELLIDIRDLSGTRRQIIPFQNLSATLGANAYQVAARFGVSAGNRTGDLSVYYGLGKNLVVRALGTVRGTGLPAASLTGLYTTAAGQGRAGVSVQPSATRPDAPEWAATLGYGLSRGSWTAGIDATIPLLSPERTQLQASAGYATSRVNVAVAAQYAWETAAWSLVGSATARLTPTLQVTGQAAATSSGAGAGWRVGAGLIWTPSPRLSAAVGASSALPVAGVDPALSVTYQANPLTALQFSADRAAARVGVAYDGPVQVSAQVGTSLTYALDASAGLVVVDGRAIAAPRASDTGLLVRTGVPGVGLVLDGSQRQTTDARGDAVFFGLTSGETAVVSVDFDRLEFGTQVGNDSQALVAAGMGLSVLDWRQNFRRVRWLQVFWSPGVPATYATLSGWPGDTAAQTDDQGNVQLTRTDAVIRADLTGEDGRRCAVTVAPQAQTVTCEAPR